MKILRVFEIISWFSLPTVMFGGFSVLRLLTKGQTLTPFQVTCFRAGHAHAGVLLLMSLLYYQYLEETTYIENSMFALCLMLVVGILAQSGGFFLHLALGREGERSAGTLLTFFGAGFLAVATLALAFGLTAFHV
jgi:hypothetical protein